MINSNAFTLFTLILMRISGAVYFSPILGRKNIPSMMKTGLIFILSILVFQVTPMETFEDMGTAMYSVLLLKELLVGFIIGYTTLLFEMVVTYAGGVIDAQLGLSMATVYDPQNGVQVALTGEILRIFFLLLFFRVNGHHALISILVDTKDIIPFGSVVIGEQAVSSLIKVFLHAIDLMVKLAFPIIAFEFLVEVGMGIFMRMVPQINLFVLSIQMRIFVGLLMLMVLASPIIEYLENLVNEMLYAIEQMTLTLT